MVSLRVMQNNDIDWLISMSADRELVGEHSWSGPLDDEQRRSRVDEMNEELEHDQPTQRGGRLIVERASGEPIGDVSWRTERWGPSVESSCPAIGIALLPQFRGRGYGTEAQRLLVRFLFETFPINRVQSDTAIDNPAEQRSLEKVGFISEGIVRDAELRNGKYYDHILYSILRREFIASPRPQGLRADRHRGDFEKDFNIGNR
jgi:RimJ/RimL family protein N-acetyltransferase